VVLRYACDPGEPVEVERLAIVAVDVVAGPPHVRQQGHRNRMRTGFRLANRLEVREG
jgi:hypothetical protein